MLKFNFRKEEAENGFVYRPKIKAAFSHNGKDVELISLLDTGSDLSYLPKRVSEYLALEVGKETEVFGFGNSKVKQSISKVNISVGKGASAKRIVSNTILIGNENDENDFPILGMEPLFQIFDINFSLKNKEIILKESWKKETKIR